MSASRGRTPTLCERRWPTCPPRICGASSTLHWPGHWGAGSSERVLLKDRGERSLWTRYDHSHPSGPKLDYQSCCAAPLFVLIFFPRKCSLSQISNLFLAFPQSETCPPPYPNTAPATKERTRNHPPPVPKKRTLRFYNTTRIFTSMTDRRAVYPSPAYVLLLATEEQLVSLTAGAALPQSPSQ